MGSDEKDQNGLRCWIPVNNSMIELIYEDLVGSSFIVWASLPRRITVGVWFSAGYLLPLLFARYLRCLSN
jgi:hypothetical protein